MDKLKGKGVKPANDNFLTAEEAVKKHKKRAELRQLISSLCRSLNEDPEFTEEYVNERVKALDDDLDAGIKCFRDLLAQFNPPKHVHGLLCRPKQGICYCTHKDENTHDNKPDSQT